MPRLLATDSGVTPVMIPGATATATDADALSSLPGKQNLLMNARTATAMIAPADAVTRAVVIAGSMDGDERILCRGLQLF